MDCARWCWSRTPHPTSRARRNAAWGILASCSAAHCVSWVQRCVALQPQSDRERAAESLVGGLCPTSSSSSNTSMSEGGGFATSLPPPRLRLLLRTDADGTPRIEIITRDGRFACIRALVCRPWSETSTPPVDDALLHLALGGKW